MKSPVILSEKDVIRHHSADASDNSKSTISLVDDLLDFLKIVNEDTLSALNERIKSVNSNYTCESRLEKVTHFIQQALEIDNEKRDFVNSIDGLECYILQANGGLGWQKGTLKLCLEFTPESSETHIDPVPQEIPASSPLDEIRQILIEQN